MRKTINRLLSLLLSVMMLASMLPVTVFAVDSVDVLDSGTSNGDELKHWIQQYQEYVLAQIAASGKIRVMAASGSASSTYSMISWASGESNRLVFANSIYVGDGIPKISLNGKAAFCGEWNGEMPSGSYIQTGEGDDPAIKQILANYDHLSKSNADYAAAQAAIWAHIMGTSVASWGTCPGAASANAIFNGHNDYSNLKYNYLEWGGRTQNLITYNIEDEPDGPTEDEDEDKDESDRYHTEVITSTSRGPTHSSFSGTR